MSEIINGRYKIIDKIGSGGMGAVFRARDRLTKETVALKRVRREPTLQLTDSISVMTMQDHQRLVLAKEFQILAGLRHPHIISVLDYGFDAEQQPYYAMAYLPESQTILSAGDGLDLEGKISLIEQLLQGLVYLHRRGIMHRDIKPENVLVVDNVVKLLDFGLSHKAEEEGAMGGSPLYMAPELIDGDEPSRGSDLYAVGVLLFQLLTGRHPFGHFDTDFYQRLLNQRPDLNEIEPSLQPIVGRLIAKDPADRYHNAAEALHDSAQAVGKEMPLESDTIRESYLQAAKFVGREVEIDALENAMFVAQRGAGSAWLVGGESGVGKSRLVNELQTSALINGFMVLRGQAINESGGAIYQLWQDVLRHLLLTVPDIDDLSASVLEPLVPDIADILERPILPIPEVNEAAAQLRLYATIARLFHSSERPILLLLENLQWASQSLTVLPYLLNEIERSPLMIIGTYRSDEEPPAELIPLFEEMEQLSLNRLDAHGIARVTEAMLGEAGRDSDLVSRLQQETEGNIFFLVEVVRELATQAGRLSEIGKINLPKQLLPDGIQTIIDRRLNRVPQADLALLHLATVVGRDIDQPLMHRFIQDNHQLDGWLGRCADASVLELQFGEWRFAHDKLREGLYARLSSEELKTFHRQIATELEEIAKDMQQEAGRLMYYWGAAGDRQKEYRFAVVAAKQAAKSYAYIEADRLLNRAFALKREHAISEEGELELRLLHEQVVNILGKRETQLEILVKLSELVKRSADNIDHFEVMIRYAKYYMAIARFDDALHYSQEILKYALEQQVEEMLPRAYLIQGQAAVWKGNYEDGLIHLEKAESFFKQLGDFKHQVEVLHFQGIITFFIKQYDRSLAYFGSSIAISREHEIRLQEARSLINSGTVDLYIGRYIQAERDLKKGRLLAEGVGDRQSISTALNNLGILAIQTAQFDQAKSYLLQALNNSRPIDFLNAEANQLHNLGIAAYETNQIDEANAYFEQALQIRERLKLADNVIEDQVRLAQIAWRQGKPFQQWLEPVLDHLSRKFEASSAEFPFKIYLMTVQLLLAQEDDRAVQILDQAYVLLHTYASAIKDPTMRASYLKNIPEHREIVRLYETRHRLTPPQIKDRSLY